MKESKNMSEIYKLIHPLKYFNDYMTRGVRPDGRKFHEQRSVKVNVKSLKTAEASAVVKCGNTTIVCGINLELATPKAEEPNWGFLITNVEVPALCSYKYKPGPPSEVAQVTNFVVSDIIANSKCINLQDLCIVPEKLAWVVHCDIICLDNDGSLVDACIIGVMASLKTLKLPKVTYDIETGEIEVDHANRTPIKIHGLPIASSFAIYKHLNRNILLTDPSAYEEDMCGGTGEMFIICSKEDLLSGTHKYGASKVATEDLEKALKIAKERTHSVENVIETCVNNSETYNL